MEHLQLRLGVAAHSAQRIGHFRAQVFRTGEGHIINLCRGAGAAINRDFFDFSATSGIIGLSGYIATANRAGAAQGRSGFLTKDSVELLIVIHLIYLLFIFAPLSHLTLLFNVLQFNNIVRC